MHPLQKIASGLMILGMSLVISSGVLSTGMAIAAPSQATPQAAIPLGLLVFLAGGALLATTTYEQGKIDERLRPHDSLKLPENVSDFVRPFLARDYNVNIKTFNDGKSGNRVDLVSVYTPQDTFRYVLKTYNVEQDLPVAIKGYDIFSKSSRTPTIIYMRGNTVAYDYASGKNIEELVDERSPYLEDAMRLTGKWLRKAHDASRVPAMGLSVDERKILRDAATAYELGKIGLFEKGRIEDKVKEYLPSYLSYTHGDAHARNFIYEQGNLNIIDLDMSGVSDPYSDLARFIENVERLAKRSSYNAHQIDRLTESLLQGYDIKREEMDRRKVLFLRGPLVESKYGGMSSQELHGIIEGLLPEAAKQEKSEIEKIEPTEAHR